MWEGGTFHLSMEFTEEYPGKAPEVRFKCSLFHPNGAPLLPCPRPPSYPCRCRRVPVAVRALRLALTAV